MNGLNMNARYEGKIKSFNPQKGWGFIECDQTQQLYGKDMFLLKNALPGGMANKGDQVTFAIVHEHNGPIASDVQIVHQVPIAPAAAFGVPALGGPAPMALGGPAPMAGMATTGPVGQSFIGSVKSFNPETGWGMISNPQMLQAYGKDVFFSKSAVQGGVPTPGEQVAFTLKMEAKGPAAASVQVLWRQQPAALASFGPMKGRWVAPGVSKLPARHQTYFGVLKSFNEEKGWGHITCEATRKVYDKDVFLLKGAMQDQFVQQGALLSFKVTMGSKGPQATSVTLLPPGSFRHNSDPPGEEPMVFVGQVKSFNPEKGWGFVSGEDLQQTFGKDIFIHKRELDGRAPSPGEEVRISVEIDEGGQPVAKAAAGLPNAFDIGQQVQAGLSARAAPY